MMLSRLLFQLKKLEKGKRYNYPNPVIQIINVFRNFEIQYFIPFNIFRRIHFLRHVHSNCDEIAFGEHVRLGRTCALQSQGKKEFKTNLIYLPFKMQDK